MRVLLAWKPILTDTAALDAAWSIQDRFGFSWRDALVVAAARRAGCRYLLTEDLSDGQRVDDLTVVNPFLTPPDALPPAERPPG